MLPPRRLSYSHRVRIGVHAGERETPVPLFPGSGSTAQVFGTPPPTTARRRDRCRQAALRGRRPAERARLLDLATSSPA